MSSGAEHQDDLERMLAASRELRERYRAASRAEPAALIDEAIRAQARRAVHARPRLAVSPFGSSWRVPMSIAAVLVVSVTLTLMIARHEQRAPTADSMAPRESAPPSTSEAKQAPRVDALPSADKDQQAKKEDTARALRDEELRVRPQRKAVSPRAEMQSRVTPSESAPAQNAAKPAPPATTKPPEPFPTAPAAAPPAPPAQAAPAPTPPPPATAAEPNASASGDAPAPGALESDGGASTEETRSLMMKRGRAPLRQQTQPPSMDALSAQKYEESQDRAKLREERAATEKELAPAAPSSGARLSGAGWESNPQAWLKHIEMLLRQNREAEARESFKAFRKHYPSYPVPSDFPLREP